MTRIIELLYMMLPIYFANMAPPFVKYWHWWNRPISKRWLGGHKTVLGFFFGVASAILIAFFQSRIHWQGDLVSYEQWFLLGLACGCGAMIGDSLKSYFKRRLNISPGQSWIPADQLDFVFGGLLALFFWARLSWIDIIMILSISFIGDILINQLSFQLGIRNTRM
jgi:CDP-2,3-bis-(O-geranylgeranyl)-sn-glycerol synthase